MTVAATALLMGSLRFEEATHTYTYDGRRVLSVTQILKLCGLSSDFSAVPPEVLERKRALGQAVHSATHFLDEFDLDAASVDPAVRPYVDAYVAFKAATGFRPRLLETRVYHPVWRYAGTFDRLGTIDAAHGEGVAVLVDLKTGNPTDSAAHLQTAAYVDAYLRTSPLPTGCTRVERWAVWLRADTTFRQLKYSDHRDLGLFRAALQVANYKAFGFGGHA